MGKNKKSRKGQKNITEVCFKESEPKISNEWTRNPIVIKKDKISNEWTRNPIVIKKDKISNEWIKNSTPLKIPSQIRKKEEITSQFDQLPPKTKRPSKKRFVKDDDGVEFEVECTECARNNSDYDCFMSFYSKLETCKACGDRLCSSCIFMHKTPCNSCGKLMECGEKKWPCFPCAWNPNETMKKLTGYSCSIKCANNHLGTHEKKNKNHLNQTIPIIQELLKALTPRDLY